MREILASGARNVLCRIAIYKAVVPLTTGRGFADTQSREEILAVEGTGGATSLVYRRYCTEL